MKEKDTLKGFLFTFLVICLAFIFVLVIAEAISNNKTKSLRVHFLDVGYGDAILIEFPDGKTMMIDAGPMQAAQKILRYLERTGIKRIDYAFITHPHENHYAGYKAILEQFPITHFYTNGDPTADEPYQEFLELVKTAEIPIMNLKARSRIDLLSDDIEVLVLHPDDFISGINENSMVTLVRYGETSFLFTGDIHVVQQEEILHRYQWIAKSDCVQIPHHGGAVSEKFANSFDNPFFVVSTGPNPWGLPLEEELKKLKGKLLRTDRQGTLVFESDGRTVRRLK